MTGCRLIYALNGEEFQVYIVGSCVAIPYDHWSFWGFGSGISIEWMLHEAGVLDNIRKARRRLIAELVRRALADAHGYTVTDCRAFELREHEGLEEIRGFHREAHEDLMAKMSRARGVTS